MKVAAITFDGDGTLWDFESSMRAALRRSADALTEAGLRHADEPVAAEWLAEVREEVASEAPFAGADMEAIRLAAFEEAIRRCDPGRLDLAESILGQYMKDRLANLCLYPEVAETLAILRGRCPLAVVTNGNTDPALVGLEATFADVLIASECGVRKPDPGIYAAAAERLGVEAGACLHVGDHAEEDVEAARRAGMRAIWVNRNGGPWPDPLPPPEAEIRNLAPLPRLL